MTDARDILTEDEAREYLGRGFQDTSKPAALPIAITAVSRKLDQLVGPVVVGGTAGTVTGELHSGGGTAIWLDYSPVYAMVQVVEYDGTTAAALTAESNTSKPTSGYHANLTNGKITRRSDNTFARFPGGIDNVYVTYVRGRYATTADVDDIYKHAAGMMLKANWRMFEMASTTLGEFDVPHASFPSFSVPKAVKELLADQWRSGQGI